jgi:ribosomal protein S18 acetylase RimI-like enzyme
MRLDELQNLLNEHSSWATGRRRIDLATMLLGSSAVVSAWQAGRMVGFGRATSDGIFRAVLWDVVVAQPLRGQGLGRSIVSELLASPSVIKSEKVYLMTTNSDGFYRKLGFNENHGQKLLVK